MGSPKPVIKAPFESFTVMDSTRELTNEERKGMSGPWRVWELCAMRSNNWGHAAFYEGELAKLATGEDSRDKRDMVTRWIKNLVKLGRVDQCSTQLCVVVNTSIAWRGSGRGKWEDICSEPSHRDIRKTPFNAPTSIDPPFKASPFPTQDVSEVPWPDDGPEDEVTDATTKSPPRPTKKSDWFTLDTV